MKTLMGTLLIVGALLVPSAMQAGNDVMGEVEFEGKSKVEKTSGVWVDGQYVGYLKELKGSKKVLLLPGEHVITVRQDGYRDFVGRLDIRPGEKRVVRVVMEKGPMGAMPAVTSEVKITVNPTRAAVFVDGLFVGHAAELQGMGRGLLVTPGPHTIKIALPGFQTFETQISPAARQKVEVKTVLLKSAANNHDPLINGNGDGNKRTSPPPPDQTIPPPRPQ
ncbi:MAG TPA: PEGA domain-containing protein [Candidatus Binatia bacterium]|nr:PEGA domain-containing protein [Candidatus Binatia bacterium]